MKKRNGQDTQIPPELGPTLFNNSNNLQQQLNSKGVKFAKTMSENKAWL